MKEYLWNEYLWEYDSEEDQAMWDALDHVEQMQGMRERQKGVHPEIIQRRKDAIANGPYNRNLGKSDDYFWETPEDKKLFERMQKCRDTWDNYDWTKFAGNYQGPLYAPHPDIHNDLQTKEDQVAPQSEPRD